MEHYSAGDVVIRAVDGMEMLIIGSADEQPVQAEAATFFCVWEHSNYLHEEVVPASELLIVRRERRRIPRGGMLDFPTQDRR